ncbi:MAG TPA: uracil-DNA glycosylase, partial [Flavobacterium sp.]|nr:uracil-DNA glycosylase [Flavobacterium sp.]
MQVKINESWLPYLQQEFEQEYFRKLVDFVKQQYQNEVCYPKGSQIFAALDYCPFEKVKVVIIGQDPYHGVSQANGLCFSVNDDQKLPPSL